jgi:branched-chain amino acid transport system substrate-binding protein
MNRRQLLMSGASLLSFSALAGLAGPAIAEAGPEVSIRRTTGF